MGAQMGAHFAYTPWVDALLRQGQHGARPQPRPEAGYSSAGTTRIEKPAEVRAGAVLWVAQLTMGLDGSPGAG